MSKNTRGNESFDEYATLLEIERVIRLYHDRYFKPIHANDDRQFHPGTVRMIDAIHPLLEHLDHGRASDGIIGASDAEGS